MYNLIRAKESNVALIIKYKLETIFEYANANADEDERLKIVNYVNNKVIGDFNDYKLIVVDSNIVGCLLVNKYEDGYLLDEIYLEDSYRGLGIGSAIIRNILMDKKTIYLWVYKDNMRAISLYKKFKFSIIDETETRYLMKNI